MRSYRFLGFVLLLVLHAFPANSYGKVIWCNPVNKGTVDGGTKTTGYPTLWEAMAAMAPNDELIIANGDWRRDPQMAINAKKMPPDGSGGFTKIRAETDWQVKLPHIRIETTVSHGYQEYRGIVFDNRFLKKGIGHIVFNMHHTKFVRCGFLSHDLTGNQHTCGFGSTDKTGKTNQYNLMEECIAWGSGRYVFYCKYGQYNIFRRCVARHDVNDAPQMFNFRAYACSYTIYQNCISVDSDRVENYAKPLNPETGGFWPGDQYGATGNGIYGCISIKDMRLPYYICGKKGKGRNFIYNSIALDVTVPGSTTMSAFVLKSNTNVIASNLLGFKALNQSQDGFYGKKGGNFSVSDSILRDVADTGLRVNHAANINHYQAGKCTPADSGNALAKIKAMLTCWGSGSTDYDPFQNGLKYPVRIEPGSPLASAGEKGGRCGPEIMKKIGVSGTLYGEPGWDKVTDENLWPFPNEEKIRELMRKTVEGVTGTYGFCVDGQTLSNYIWGYLGNTVPPFNVKALPGDGKVTLTWDPPAEIARKTIIGYRVYRLAGKTKTIQGEAVTGNMNCSKTVTGLQNKIPYEFSVTAVDKNKGESGLSYKIRVIPGRIDSTSNKKEDAPAVASSRTEPEDTPSKKRVFSNKLGMEFVLIQPGTFTMGIIDNPGSAPHQVTINKSFYMQKGEVTQGHWKKIMGKNPSFYKSCGKDCPVEQVSWHEVQQFIEKLNRLENAGNYRLPTEAEWEYACRAGTITPFSFGECLTSKEANFNGNHPYLNCEMGAYLEKPISVRAFVPNPWGLIGMHGNVWEWCRDWLGEFAPDPVTDPEGPVSGTLKVIRGGGWNSYAKACRSGNRSGVKPTDRYANLGFRLVYEP